MLSVEQALEQILGSVNVLDAVDSPLLDSLGLVINEDIIAGINVPSSDIATMDGYAIRASDSAGAAGGSPRLLRVVATIAAGSKALCRVEPGTAVRIMTGAPLPPGADAVARFEDTDEAARQGADDKIGILKEAKTGLFIRKAGEDVARGEKVLAAGELIRPAEIGVLASVGLANVKVIRRPRVAVVATGDELIEVGKPFRTGKIYNSNCYHIAASVLRFGGIPIVPGIARDNEASLIKKLEQAADADIVVSAGGTSAGDYDLVKEVLAKNGEVVFDGINMKPGRSLAFGIFRIKDKSGATRNVPHLVLPGNPTASMIGVELFLRPSILKMLGRTRLARPAVRAIIEEAKENREHTRIFNRAIVTRRDGNYYASLSAPKGEGVLTGMSKANGLAVIPEDKDRVGKGDFIQVIMLDWDETVF